MSRSVIWTSTWRWSQSGPALGSAGSGHAARVLGLGRNTAYELVRSGAWPTPLVRFGRLIKVPRSSLLDLLGIPTTVEHVHPH